MNPCMLLIIKYELFKLLTICYSIGKLNSSPNLVDMKILSRFGRQKVGPDHRNFRVYALFGGKKENNDKSDDAPSKVSQVSFLLLSMLNVNMHRVTNLLLNTYFLLCLHFSSFTCTIMVN